MIISEFTTEVFRDAFETNSASRWLVFSGAANGTNDFTVDWAFDYGTYFSVYNNSFIPPAPSTTGGTTRGVKLTVNNNDAVGSQAGVSLYPAGLNLNGAYKLKLDLWINYPGGAGGSGAVGSTEKATFGLNHAGTRVNWGHSSSTPSDGVWFAVTGDGGDNPDYRAYVGNAASSPTLLSFANSGVGASGASSGNNAASYFQGIFPSPPYETAGSPGKKWVEVEVSQDANNVLTWKMNGNLIAQRTNTSSFTNGTVMIGYMDLFTSIANPAADSFVIFDNVRVEQVGAAIAPAITAHPQDQVVLPESQVTFTVAATGTAPLSYQWYFEDAPIDGATGSSFTRPTAEPEHEGHYHVVVSNPAGSIASAEAHLTLIDSPEISNIQSAAGRTTALITWETTVLSDSQVEYDIHEAHDHDGHEHLAGGKGTVVSQGHAKFNTLSHLDTNLVFQHSILLTDLLPDTEYGFQVVSHSGTNEFRSAGYHFKTAGQIILDNHEASFTGSWSTGTISTDKFSTDYHFANTVVGAPTATATFRPKITTPGLYDVYIWFSQGSNRATNAPFQVAHASGTETFLVNQTINGGKWLLLAAGREFASGTNGFVRLSNDSSPTGKVVMADAVRFDYVISQEQFSSNSVPAWWSQFYFGANVAGSLDHDGDGYSTAQEYLLGTNPNSAQSRVTVQANSTGSNLQIRYFPAMGGRLYRLQTQSNLQSNGAWTPLPQLPVSDGYGGGIFTVTNAVPTGFFRLDVSPAP